LYHGVLAPNAAWRASIVPVDEAAAAAVADADAIAIVNRASRARSAKRANRASRSRRARSRNHVPSRWPR